MLEADSIEICVAIRSRSQFVINCIKLTGFMCKWVILTIEIAINEITIAKCAMPCPGERI